MAAVSIVINAINNAKAAFNEVGNQATALNKKLGGISRTFKGLFIAGVVAKAIQMFAGASTESDKLKQSINRIKEAFAGVAAIIGNVLVRALHLITPIIEAIGKAAEFTFSLFETRAQTAARRAAQAQRKLAEETATLAKQREDAEKKRISEIEKAEKESAERRKRYEEQVQSVRNKLTDKRVKKEEEAMSAENLLVRRRGELAGAERRIADPKTDELTRAVNEELRFDLLEDIKRLEDEIQLAKNQAAQDELEDGLEGIEKERKAWAEAEAEKGRKIKERLSMESKLQIQNLNDQASAFRQQAKEREDRATKLEDLARSKGWKDKPTPEERRLSRMSPRRLMRMAEEERKKAEKLQKEAEKLEQEAMQAQINSEAHLASIDEKIESLLTLKG